MVNIPGAGVPVIPTTSPLFSGLMQGQQFGTNALAQQAQGIHNQYLAPQLQAQIGVLQGQIPLEQAQTQLAGVKAQVLPQATQAQLIAAYGRWYQGQALLGRTQAYIAGVPKGNPEAEAIINADANLKASYAQGVKHAINFGANVGTGLPGIPGIQTPGTGSLFGAPPSASGAQQPTDQGSQSLMGAINAPGFVPQVPSTDLPPPAPAQDGTQQPPAAPSLLDTGASSAAQPQPSPSNAQLESQYGLAPGTLGSLSTVLGSQVAEHIIPKNQQGTMSAAKNINSIMEQASPDLKKMMGFMTAPGRVGKSIAQLRSDYGDTDPAVSAYDAFIRTWGPQLGNWMRKLDNARSSTFEQQLMQKPFDPNTFGTSPDTFRYGWNANYNLMRAMAQNASMPLSQLRDWATNPPTGSTYKPTALIWPDMPPGLNRTQQLQWAANLKQKYPLQYQGFHDSLPPK